MMKKLKSWVLVLVAAFMFCASATQALAEGAITVANPGAESYEGYKIFNAEKDASGNVSYILPAASKWLNALYDTDNEESKVDGLEFTVNQSGDYEVKKMNSFSAAAFGEYLKENIPAEETPVAFTDGSSGAIPAGYYLVISKLEGNVQDRVSLTTVLDGETVTIQNKNDMPFDKEVLDNGNWVKQNGVKLGDSLDFRITGKVPVADADDTSYTYQVADTMDAGLTFGGSITVKINGETVALTEVSDENAILTGDQVRYGKNGKTFELSLEMLNRAKNTALQGKDIEITYTAVVNENAPAVVSENKAVLLYGNDPTNLISKDTMTKHYTSKIVIDKYETGAPEQKLANAKFVLKNSEGKFYKIANHVVTWVDDQADADVVVTDTNGRAEFEGLDDGTYSLKETEAPRGYSLLAGEISIVVDGSDSTVVPLTAEQIALALTETINVANTPGTLLPSTGGAGTMMFYLAGGAIAIGAFFALLKKKKEEEA